MVNTVCLYDLYNVGVKLQHLKYLNCHPKANLMCDVDKVINHPEQTILSEVLLFQRNRTDIHIIGKKLPDCNSFSQVLCFFS